MILQEVKSKGLISAYDFKSGPFNSSDMKYHVFPLQKQLLYTKEFVFFKGRALAACNTESHKLTTLKYS